MIGSWESIVNDVVNDDDTSLRVLRKIRSSVEFELNYIERDNETSDTYKGLKIVKEKIDSKVNNSEY